MSRLCTAPLLIALSLVFVAACGEDRPEPVGPEATLEPTAGAAAVASNTWVRFADLPTARRGAAMAAVPKADGTSRLFAIAGGLRRTRVVGCCDTIITAVPVGTVTEYVPGTDRWVRRADAPYVWQVVPQAAVLNGKIYMPGGLEGTGENLYAIRTMAVYTVATNTWTTVNMPQFMTAQTVWTSGGALYVFGRCLDTDTEDIDDFGIDCQQSGAPPKFLLRYTPATNTWTYLPTPPVPARENPVSGIIGGQAYVTDGGSSALDAYNLSTGVWRGRQPLDRVRLNAAGGAVKGRLYVAGGRMVKPDGSLGQSRALSEYNPTTNTWVNRAQVPEVFPWGIRATRVVIGGQARLAILGDFGKHYQWTP